MTMATLSTSTPELTQAPASSTQTLPQTPILAFKGTSAVKLLLSCLIVAALVATHSPSNQQGNALHQAANGGAGASSGGAGRRSRLRGVTKSYADRNLAGVALSIAGGGGSSNAGAITGYAGNNEAIGRGGGGGSGSSQSFSQGNTGAAFGFAGGRTINNSTTMAKSDDIAMADANANSTTDFNSYGIGLYYDNGALGGYYGFGNGYGFGFGYGLGEAPASSRGTGFGSQTSYGGGVAYLGLVGAQAQGDNLAKGMGSGGGRKPTGYALFGGGGGGGGDQYGGSVAAFGPRFNNSAYGLPELPGGLSQLTRPNKTATGDNVPVGGDGGFNLTDGTTLNSTNP
jgi:hypothetical protein